MTDDLNHLKALLDQATPPPSAKNKAANIALAKKHFANGQGSQTEPRPTHDRPHPAGLWKGAKSMLNALTSRAGLLASSAVAGLALVVVTVPLNHTQPNTKAKRLGSADHPAAAKPDENLTPPQPSRQRAVGTNSYTKPAANAPGIAAGAPPTSTRNERPAFTDFSAKIADHEALAPAPPNTERFANGEPNRVKITTQEPVSTFSIDVDTAAYAIMRNSLTQGQLPPTQSVRVEEMINYFTYAYPAPEPGNAFATHINVSPTPWNRDTRLVEIGIQGALPETNGIRPPLNLVFLIDTSGSMNHPSKLPLLKQSLRLMLTRLQPDDEVAIVTYAGSAGVALPPTPAAERNTILNALNTLQPSGSTAGQAGLAQAYATARNMSKEGDVSRVLLATDGDFNVGPQSPEALRNYIAKQRESGVYLTVLGFGRGNLNDALMQSLAQNGNGTAAYIDTLSEAQKVLVDQLSAARSPIANDVKIQVEFNPAEVAEYRLIGYETRHLRREDFNNDKVDAGDIGAGHQVTALYEVVPKGSKARLTNPLRYGQNPAVAAGGSYSGELGYLRVRYKAPGAQKSKLIETPIPSTTNTAPSFAAAIAGFGQLLRQNPSLGNWTYQDAIALAQNTRGSDPYGYRAEAIRLMQLAESLAH